MELINLRRQPPEAPRRLLLENASGGSFNVKLPHSWKGKYKYLDSDATSSDEASIPSDEEADLGDGVVFDGVPVRTNYVACVT